MAEIENSKYKFFVIDSPIDVHAHLREPGTNTSETIASGTYAAAMGGYQAMFDMPNTPGRPTWTEERVAEKQEIAKNTSQLDIGFYAGVDLANPDVDQLPRMMRWVPGLKLYMGPTTGNAAFHNLDTARPVIDTWIDQARQQGFHAPILLHAIGEVGAEIAEYIASQGHFAHWCHVATAEEAEAATRLTKRYGRYFTAGVTPHHLTMTHINADFQQGWNGARMQPPLGREADHDALLSAYNDGYIQIIETDHAPHSAEDKQRAEQENPEGHTGSDCTTCYGVSGIEFVLPVMMTMVKRGKIKNRERLERSLYHEPKRMLGLGKAAMQAKTIMAWDTHVIGENDIRGRSKNTPYVGWQVAARVTGQRIRTAERREAPVTIVGAQPRAA